MKIFLIGLLFMTHSFAGVIVEGDGTADLAIIQPSLSESTKKKMLTANLEARDQAILEARNVAKSKCKGTIDIFDVSETQVSREFEDSVVKVFKVKAFCNSSTILD